MANPNVWAWKSVAAPPRPAKHSPWRVALELLIPLAIAALFYYRGKLVPAAVVGVVGVSLFAVSRASPAAASKIQLFFGRFSYWVGEALTWILLLPVFFLVFTPVAIWSRLKHVDPLDAELDQRKTSYWVAAGHDRPKFRYFHQFSDETYAAAPRSGKSPILIRLVTTVLWLLLINSLIGAGIRAAGWADRAPLDARANSKVYATETWAPEYFRELAAASARYRPFLGWQRKDFPVSPNTSELIHVVDGIRETTNVAPPDGVKPLEVYFFGGSTVWGVGSRDRGTLPSAFARVASAAGFPVHVTNLGEDGYVQWQEVLRLDERVADGKTPDLAIFYDGANDVFTHFQTPQDGERERIHQNLPKWQARFLDRHDLASALIDTSGVHLLMKIVASRGTAPAPRFKLEWPKDVTVEKVAATVARRHREDAAFAERIGHEYGFGVMSFWQPTVFTKRQKTAEEQDHAAAFGDDLKDIYVGARAAIGNQIVDLGDTFADESKDVYIDWCHVGEDGNEVLARRVLENVAPVLRARLAARGEPNAK